MLKRAIVIGIIGGVIISLAALYPIVSLLTPLWLDGWQRPVDDDLMHGIWLMASAALAVPTFLLIGVVAVIRSGARGWRDGGVVGLVAGLTAAGICYFTIIAPVNALIAYGAIGHYLDVLADSYLPPLTALRTYVVSFQNTAFQVQLILIASGAFWGAQGAVTGWLRRDRPLPERPSLFALIQNGDAPKAYFAGDESALSVGIVVGTAISVLAVLAVSGWSFLAISDWPELVNALQSSQAGLVSSNSISGAIALFSPAIILAFAFFGALVVFFTKNPPNWFRARAFGITLAGVIIATAVFALLLRLMYFNLGLSPFWILRSLDEGIQAEALADQRMMIDGIITAFAEPGMLIAGVMSIPWLFLLAALLTGIILGAIQSLIFVPVFSMIRKRPVDRAFVANRQLKSQPNEILPGVYNLFRESEQAYEVLAHLSVRTWKHAPAVSRFAAAFHTLGTSRQEREYGEAIASIHDTLSEHREWRWALEFAGAYNTLSQVIRARTLDQILAIEPPPEQHTSSLPPLEVKMQQRIGRIVAELKKVERTDDLATKLIFLENTQAVIHETQRFVDQAFTAADTWATPLPQHNALLVSLAHWEAVLLTALRRLKGRADLVSRLTSRTSTFAAELPLTLCVRNQGLNVAQQVRLRLQAGEGYDLLGTKSEAFVEILPPGEEVSMTILFMPRPGVPQVRIAWDVSYDDAVDEERLVPFADKLEFVEADRPFTRVFPIPYVTGTPLKTDDVFVGRSDVFGFIQEMLVGAHQNNMVILHGQRRTGKTSVLYRLHDMLVDTHYAVMIDMQGKPARGEAEFLYSIADDILFTLEDHGIEMALPPRAEFEADPEFFFRSRFLRQLIPYLAGKNLLLMFDEFEELQRRVQDGRLQPDIFQYLRNLMQHETHVDFIFAGTHKLEELGSEYWSALFNIAAYRPITFLRPVEMRGLILEPIKAYNTEFDPLAVDRIIQVTAGHPYFAQLLLHEMMVYHNEMQASYLTMVDVDQVIERIISRGEAHFRYIWDESAGEEQLVLQSMAELLYSAEAVTAKEIRSFLQERGSMSPDRWKEALAGLEGRDIITRGDARSPLYRFQVDLIRLWIQYARPVLS